MQKQKVKGVLDLVYEWMQASPEMFNDDVDNYNKLYNFLTTVCEMDGLQALTVLREQGWLV